MEGGERWLGWDDHNIISSGRYGNRNGGERPNRHQNMSVQEILTGGHAIWDAERQGEQQKQKQQQQQQQQQQRQGQETGEAQGTQGGEIGEVELRSRGAWQTLGDQQVPVPAVGEGQLTDT
ncbi:unnamed protein product, partial [Discosporangium mesarthrocarpum]